MKSFSFAGLSLFLVSPAKIQNGGLDVDAARELGIFFDEENVINLEDDGEINILSAVATFMRRNLNRNQGCYECSLSAYSNRMRHKLSLILIGILTGISGSFS